MTRSCRNVLNHLRELSDNDFQLLTYVADAPYVCLFNDLRKYYDYTEYISDFGAILKELEHTGYVEIDDRGVLFSLTYKGLHPSEIAWEEMKSFLFRSVAVPIVISAVTSLITFYITTALS